jgi:hypothetical protein
MNLDSVATGPLAKAAETVRIFVSRQPSIRDLLASRHGTVDRIHAVVPSTVTAGESVGATVQVWDEYERLHDFSGDVVVDVTDEGATRPDRLTFDADDGGVRTVPDLSFETPGVHYLRLRLAGGGEWFVSNPVRVHADVPDERVYWGDIHLHSHLSDGTGSMAEGFRFGRDVMDLDVVAYSDHDTMGFFVPPSLQRRRMHRRYFDRMKAATESFNDPGEFVTLFAYEWTKQPNCGGHVNVYFDGVEDAPLFDSRGATTNTYEKLWARLREWNERHETQAVTIPHHPTESMYPFDFSAVDYDDELAPLVEVYSQWGSGERPASDGNRYPLEMGQGEVEESGHHVRDALRMGARVGMVASADYHGSHPGHSLIHAKPHLPSLRDWIEGGLGWSNIWRVWNERSYPGGLCAFRAGELSREAVFDALRSRRVYGTTQPDRILVAFDVAGVAPGDAGSTVALDAADAPREVSVSVAGTAPVERVEVVKNTEEWRTIEGTADPGAGLDAYTVEGSWTDGDPVEGMSWDDDRGSDADAYYVRVTQAADHDFPGMAWAGPVWVEAR